MYRSRPTSDFFLPLDLWHWQCGHFLEFQESSSNKNTQQAFPPFPFLFHSAATMFGPKKKEWETAVRRRRQTFFPLARHDPRVKVSNLPLGEKERGLPPLPQPIFIAAAHRRGGGGGGGGPKTSERKTTHQFADEKGEKLIFLLLLLFFFLGPWERDKLSFSLTPPPLLFPYAVSGQGRQGSPPADYEGGEGH